MLNYIASLCLKSYVFLQVSYSVYDALLHVYLHCLLDMQIKFAVNVLLGNLCLFLCVQTPRGMTTLQIIKSNPQKRKTKRHK